MAKPDLKEFFEQAKLELIARGFDFAAVNEGEDSTISAKRGAWAITALGAWLAHQAGHTDLGLVAKRPPQNHYSPREGEFYAVDGVMFQSGEGFDVVEKAETLNRPMWGRFEHDPPIESWRPVFDPRPFLALGTAPEPKPGPIVPDPGTPPPTVDLRELRMMLTDALVSLEELKATVGMLSGLLAALQIRHDPVPLIQELQHEVKTLELVGGIPLPYRTATLRNPKGQQQT